jgi:flagellar basal body-associated protein FliL
VEAQEESRMRTDEQPIRIDKAAARAWTIFGVLVVVFILGLVIVSFWGGPFESDSYWRQEEAPAYPN